VDVFNEIRARDYIFNKSNYVRDELNKLDIITNEEIFKYQEELEARWKKEAEKRKKAQEEHDYEYYLELKKRFKERDTIENCVEMKRFRKIALGSTRDEFMERCSNMCLYSVYGIGHVKTDDYCSSVICSDCKNKAIENVKFKGE
jgi:hypothetical protein